MNKTSNMSHFKRPCSFCKKNLDIQKNKFYTIGKEPGINSQQREYKKTGCYSKTEILYFHPDCFATIAGKEYL